MAFSSHDTTVSWALSSPVRNSMSVSSESEVISAALLARSSTPSHPM